MKKIKKYIYPALIVLFSAVLIGSSIYLIDYYVKAKKHKDMYAELSGLVEQLQQQTPGNSTGSNNSGGEDSGAILDTPNSVTPLTKYVDVIHPKTGQTIQVLREYAPVFERNSDTVGWIKIPGTPINYPVVQTIDNPNFYLKRDFNKESSRYGAIYASELADIERPSDNITLYGHRMADGSMFAALHNYMDKSFYTQYPYITFDTLTQHRQYQIIAVFRTTATVGSFAYHTFADGNVISFMDFVNQCKALSLYDTGVEATYGDKLLTLSTCDHSVDYGRLVVVAKQIN